MKEKPTKQEEQRHYLTLDETILIPKSRKSKATRAHGAERKKPPRVELPLMKIPEEIKKLVDEDALPTIMKEKSKETLVLKTHDEQQAKPDQTIRPVKATGKHVADPKKPDD